MSYGYDEISGYGEELVEMEGDFDDEDETGWDDMVGDEVDTLLSAISGDDDDDLDELGALVGEDDDDLDELGALVGDDDDDDDMVGAVKRYVKKAKKTAAKKRAIKKLVKRTRRPRPNQAQSIARAVSSAIRSSQPKGPQPKQSSTMMRLRPRSTRRYPLGLGTTALLAGATAVIAVNPQLPFKLMRLSTPSTNVTIDNIQIGTVSQFVAAGGIPAEVFAPNAIGVDLKGDTAVPGVQIQITVTDTSGAPNTFRGAFFGLVAQ